MSTPPDRAAAEAAFACAALLAQGRKLQSLSLVLTGLALLALVTVGSVPASRAALVIGVVLLGLVALYYAVRVGLDARLMRRFAELADRGRLDLAAIDSGLAFAGLRAVPAGAPRDLADRMRGARRLLRNQAIAVLLQLGVFVAGTVHLGIAP